MIVKIDEYCSFADESYVSAERFRSISSFSFQFKFKDIINEKLVSILKKSEVNEFKWQKLRDAKHRFCAIDLLTFIIDNLLKFDLRIDTIIWDAYDKRHTVINRDDLDNFGRMFYHLHKFLIEKRVLGSNWRLYHDERDGIDWLNINNCLMAVGDWVKVVEIPLFKKKISKKNYNIFNLTSVDSKLEPCCQISDLFAGLSVFSANKFYLYLKWLDNQSTQGNLFNESKELHLSKSEQERFYILKIFYEKCRVNKLGVSLKTNKRLETINSNHRINFWFYKPQHSDDKAPTKK